MVNFDSRMSKIIIQIDERLSKNKKTHFKTAEIEIFKIQLSGESMSSQKRATRSCGGQSSRT